MAEWQTKKLKSTGGDAGEGFDERMAREKQERWESSAEFQAEQEKKEATNANIDLASATQVTDADIAQEKLSEQGDKAALLRSWIAEVTGEPLPAQSDDLSAELKSGVVLCNLLDLLHPRAPLGEWMSDPRYLVWLDDTAFFPYGPDRVDPDPFHRSNHVMS